MAVSTFSIKQNDTLPKLERALVDDRGRATNLTGASVVFHMRLASDLTAKITNGSVTIEDSVKGQVSYTFTDSNTDTSGVYDGEFQVTFSGGGVETFPNNSNIRITITDDVA